MSISIRHLLLGCTLLITIWLSWSSRENKVEEIVLSSDASNQVANGKAPLFLLEPRNFSLSKTNLFSSTAKPQKKHRATLPEQLETATPQLPALPFKYLGRWKDSHGSHFFLDVAGEVVSIQTNQMVTSEYRVIEIKETSSEAEIIFLYLPLNQKQTMYIGKHKS